MGIELGMTVRSILTTHDLTTGALVDADATPTATVYEDGTSIGYSPTVTSLATGIYDIAVAATSGNGFEVGKNYSVVATFALGGVSRGTSIANWRMEAPGMGGPYALTITCQEPDTTKIPGCLVKVRATGETEGWTKTTDANGEAVFYVTGEAAPDDIEYTIYVAPPTGYEAVSSDTQTVAGADVAKTITVTPSAAGTGASLEDGRALSVRLATYSPDSWVQGSRKPELHFVVEQDGETLDATGYEARLVCWDDDGTAIEDHTVLAAHSITTGVFSFDVANASTSWDTLTPGRYTMRIELVNESDEDDRYMPDDEVVFTVKQHYGTAH